MGDVIAVVLAGGMGMAVLVGLGVPWTAALCLVGAYFLGAYYIWEWWR